MILCNSPTHTLHAHYHLIGTRYAEQHHVTQKGGLVEVYINITRYFTSFTFISLIHQSFTIHIHKVFSWKGFNWRGQAPVLARAPAEGGILHWLSETPLIVYVMYIYIYIVCCYVLIQKIDGFWFVIICHQYWLYCSFQYFEDVQYGLYTFNLVSLPTRIGTMRCKPKRNRTISDFAPIAAFRPVN